MIQVPIIISREAPSQKNVIWATPSGDGYLLYVNTEGMWKPAGNIVDKEALRRDFFGNLTPELLELIKGDKGDKGNPFTYADFTPEQLNALKGDSISGIMQTRSLVDGGVNTITVTTERGATYQFLVLNGSKGDKGEQGDSAIWDENEPHEKLTDLANILGDSTVKPMSQNGVTKAIVNYAYRGTQALESTSSASLRIVTNTTPATTATASAETNKIFYAFISKDSYVKVKLTKTKAANKKVVIAIFDTEPNAAGVEVKEILFDGEVVYEDGETTKTFVYDYYVKSGLYIGLYEISTYSTCVFEGGVTAFDEVDAAKSDISSVAEEVRGETIELEEGTNFTYTTGKYINKNGVPTGINNSKYTSPIQVYAGDKIVYTCNGSTSGNIASLSKVVTENTSYVPLIVDKDGVKTRTFFVEEDMQVAFSALRDDIAITIHRGGFSNITEKIEKEVEDLQEETAKIVKYDPRDGMPVLGENPLERIITGPSMARIFASYGVIGASFECGVENPSTQQPTQIWNRGYEWPALLGKMNSIDVYNYAIQGRALWQWMTYKDDSQQIPPFPNTCIPWSQHDTPAECYIINMSSNDLDLDKYNGDPGNVAEINVTHDYSQDTFSKGMDYTEVIAGIIQLCRHKSPKCFIFLATVRKTNLSGGGYRNAEEIEALCDAMKGVADLFDNCFVLDMNTYGFDWPSYGRTLGYQSSVNLHPTRLGHIYLANQFNTYIDWFVRNNPTAFHDVSLILRDN